MRIFLLTLVLSCSWAEEFRGRQFIALGTVGGDHVSEWINPRVDWNELVVSWNFRGAPEEGITIEAQVSRDDRVTKWYCLGKWARVPGAHPRESVKGQGDEDGTVETDTLKLKRSGGAVRVRVTSSSPVDFLGLSFLDRQATLAPLDPNTNAWGKILQVEERSQADFPEGIREWCSPTATSMLLNFWSRKLRRPELNYTVPEVARAVNDPNWPGTGNWPFNTAFAGSHEGIRAYVARFGDVSEIEDWIEAGVPLAFSVSYGFLKGQSERGGGHLLVAIGFTQNGDIIVNDPGRREVRQTYTRANLIKAWAESGNTVYLIYPEGMSAPRDRFGHW
jgi:hypothetical protein